MAGKDILYVILFGLTFVVVGLILVMINPYCLFVIIGMTSGYNCGDLSFPYIRHFIQGSLLTPTKILLVPQSKTLALVDPPRN